MPHLKEFGADGVGLFRTELLFMLSNTLPQVERQANSYRAVRRPRPTASRWSSARSTSAATRCCTTCASRRKRTRPWAGGPCAWALDRPALLRTQVRAMLRAAAGQELRVMIPMVSTAAEMDRRPRAGRKGTRHSADASTDTLPKRVLIGAMIEVPCLLFELDALMKKVDFVSVGSNDLMQFMFAADRTNARVGSRYRRRCRPRRCGR